MSANFTLILGNDQDEHALHMLRQLKRRSVDVELIDSRWFPHSLGLSLDPQSGIWQVDFPNGRRLSSDHIRSVYWRTYDGIGGADLADEQQRFIAENDSRSLFESFLIHLPARWVNGWSAFQLHQTKPVQLAMAARLGLSTPRTLLTNVANEVTTFASGTFPCIYKPVQGGDHTRFLDHQHLSARNLESLRQAPVTLQEAVPGTNVRVFVAGQQVVACEVKTNAIDYRDDLAAELLPHAIPSKLAEECRLLARKLQLHWTGIDFRLTPDGQYVFLEANPSPMFLGFEMATGLPLTRLLIDLLVTDESFV